MGQITYLNLRGESVHGPLPCGRKPGQRATGTIQAAGMTSRGITRSPVHDLVAFEADCDAALRSLQGDHFRPCWISVPLPARAFYDAATLARLERLAADDAAGFAKLRFEVDHRHFVAELEHIVGVQAALGAARLALAVQLNAGMLPLAGELSRGGVKLLYAPSALSAAAAVDHVAREELRYVARLARSLGIESAVHADRNRSALAQCQLLGIDRVAGPCHARGAGTAGSRLLVAGANIN